MCICVWLKCGTRKRERRREENWERDSIAHTHSHINNHFHKKIHLISFIVGRSEWQHIYLYLRFSVSLFLYHWMEDQQLKMNRWYDNNNSLVISNRCYISIHFIIWWVHMNVRVRTESVRCLIPRTFLQFSNLLSTFSIRIAWNPSLLS